MWTIPNSRFQADVKQWQAYAEARSEVVAAKIPSCLKSNNCRRNTTKLNDTTLLGFPLGARLKPNVVPAKLFQCSRLSGRNKKTSKYICPPTKPTRTWWQNMLFASLGGPRWYAYICCPARCHVKKTCFQKQFLLEHHWNTAGTSYWNVAGPGQALYNKSKAQGRVKW